MFVPTHMVDYSSSSRDLRSSSQLHGHYIYVLHIHTGGERLINYLSRMDFNEVKIS